MFVAGASANPSPPIARWVARGLPTVFVQEAGGAAADRCCASRRECATPPPWDPLNMWPLIQRREYPQTYYATVVDRIDQLEGQIEALGALDSFCARQRLQHLRSLQDVWLVQALCMEQRQVFQASAAAGVPAPPLCLPNLTFLMIYLGFWSTRWETARNDSPFGEHSSLLPLLRFFGKFLPHACRRRDMVHIIEKTLLANEIPALKSTLLSCIVHSLLGDYSWCRSSAGFFARKHVYQFFVLSNMTEQRLARWCADNILFVLFAVREYLMYMIQRVPALHATLERLYYWATIVDSTVTALDHVRCILSRRAMRLAHGYAPGSRVDAHEFQRQHPRAVLKGCVHDNAALGALLQSETEAAGLLCTGIPESLLWQCGAPLLSRCDRVFAQAAKRILAVSPRPNDDCVVFHVTRAMRALVCRSAPEMVVGQAHAQGSLQGFYAFQALDLPRDLIPQLRYVLRESWQRVRDKRAPDWGYDWMVKIYGLTLDNCCLFRTATGFFVNDSEKSEVRTALTRIFQTNRRDFFLLLAMMEAIVYERSLLLYPLSGATVIHQQKTFAADGAGVATTLLWCPNCTEFKHGHIDPVGRRPTGKSRASAKTHADIIHDMDLEDPARPFDLYCLLGKKRRPRRDHTDPDTPMSHTAQACKTLLGRTCYAQCADTLCVPVDLLGRIARVTDIVTLRTRLFYLCPFCGALTVFRYKSFRGTSPMTMHCGCRAGKKAGRPLAPSAPARRDCVLCGESRTAFRWILFWNDVEDVGFRVDATYRVRGALRVYIAPICTKKPCSTINFGNSKEYLWRFSEILMITRSRNASAVTRIGELNLLHTWTYAPRTGVKDAANSAFDRKHGVAVDQLMKVRRSRFDDGRW